MSNNYLPAEMGRNHTRHLRGTKMGAERPALQGAAKPPPCICNALLCHFDCCRTMPNPTVRARKPKRKAKAKDDGPPAKQPAQDPSVSSEGSKQTGGPGLTTPTNVPPATKAVHPTTVTTKVFTMKTGIEVQPLSRPPSVVAVSPAPETNMGNGDHESKTWFEACQRNGRMDNDAMLTKDISAYVRYDLFHKLKFIMNNKQLNYSSEPTSICGQICIAMGLLEEKEAVSWWERYKEMIADVLNAKRADVTGALKRAFLRKLCGVEHCVYWFTLLTFSML